MSVSADTAFLETRKRKMYVLNDCPGGGAGLSSAHPEHMPPMTSEGGNLPRARKVNPKYAGVEHVRRLLHPDESKVASALPETTIQVVHGSGKKKRKASIAIQVGILLLKS